MNDEKEEGYVSFIPHLRAYGLSKGEKKEANLGPKYNGT